MLLLWLRQLPWCGYRTPASVPPPAKGRSSPTNTPISPPVPLSYEVLHGSVYSFLLVRYSCSLSAGVLHEFLCLKVYSWCIHGERHSTFTLPSAILFLPCLTIFVSHCFHVQRVPTIGCMDIYNWELHAVTGAVKIPEWLVLFECNDICVLMVLIVRPIRCIWKSMRSIANARLKGRTLLRKTEAVTRHLLFVSSIVRIQFNSVQSLSCIWLLAIHWTPALQASLSNTNFRSLLKLMFIKSVMPFNHFTLCCPLILLPPIFPSIRVFSNEPVLRIR